MIPTLETARTEVTTSTRRAFLGLALAAMSPLAAADEHPGATRIVFGLIAPRQSDEIRSNWTPFARKLGDALRAEVQLAVFDDASKLTASFARGEIDLAWVGNSVALGLVEAGTATVFAQMVNRVGGAGYNAVIVVPRQSAITSLAGLLAQAPGLRFADGELDSTSGHLIPQYYAFQKNGVDSAAAVFRQVTHAKHQKNLQMVARGEADAGTANTEELHAFEQSSPSLASAVRVLWTSPVISQSPLVWRTTLSADLRRKIQQFVVNFGGSDPEQVQILERLNNLSGFRRSSNRQLVPVADIEMFKERQAITDDHKLGEAERNARIDAVIRRASKLEIMLKLSSDASR